ncbi:UNVERIFIED_CONTAM: hypothetical protein Sradi_3879400 [Sesamum radiatum]|uniref:Uncharacterized protein n=1 Tax=Sesamum radiatum TaxID=300843 RepID=A0AAW2Q2E1_SESRA
MKIKFPVLADVGEVQGDPLQSSKMLCGSHLERAEKEFKQDVKRRTLEQMKEGPHIGGETKDGEETPIKVQPAKELLAIELIPKNPKETIGIGSQMEDTMHEEVIQCL